MLIKAHAQRRLTFFADHAALADKRAFKRFLAPLRKIEWVVYSKNPFAGPEQVLRYLSRYTHRVAISNRRLVSTDDNGVAFRWKDYRIDGPEPLEDDDTAPPRVHPALPAPTCCPKASTASAITACSPAAIAPPTSHAHASCSVLPRASLSMKSRRPLPPMSRASCPAPALAAAAK